jgi:hypothetical protein
VAFVRLGKEATRVVLYLLLDHAQNAGVENGRLTATYEQLIGFGIGKNTVSKAIEEACAFGLLRKTEQGGRYGETNRPNRYRLTFLGWWDQNGEPHPPTHEWKGITEENIERWRNERRAARPPKRRSVKTPQTGKVVPLPRGNAHPQKRE